MFHLALHEDPIFGLPTYRHASPFNRYNSLRREMEDMILPAFAALQAINTPRVVGGQSDKFEVKVDVQHFAPEELSVKMQGGFVVVEGKHEERQDDQGYISRHFVRRYGLPEDVKPETLNVNLSSDGVLQITAPRAIKAKEEREQNIPINFTGKPHAVTDNPGDKQSDNSGSNQKATEGEEKA